MLLKLIKGTNLRSVVVRWMNVELLHRVKSERESKYQINTWYMVSRKQDCRNSMCSKARDADIETRLVDTTRKESGGQTEWGALVFTHYHVENMVVWKRLKSARSSCWWCSDDLEGGGSVGGRIYVYVWLIHCCTAETKKKNCKAIVFPQLKKKFKQNKQNFMVEQNLQILGFLGHESAFPPWLVAFWLKPLPSTNNCLFDTEVSYTKVFLMMKITLHDFTLKKENTG